jgi:hypothetical protein
MALKKLALAVLWHAASALNYDNLPEAFKAQMVMGTLGICAPLQDLPTVARG